MEVGARGSGGGAALGSGGGGEEGGQLALGGVWGVG